MRSLLCLVVLCFAIIVPSEAKKKSKKKNKTYLTLVEAYTQRIIPGIPGPPPPTGTHIVIVWEGPKYPEVFFWRGDGGWLSCNMTKAHRIVNRRNIRATYTDYEIEKIAPDQVHKGDTLELSPVTGGKFPVPANLPADAKNTLFFKTGGSDWLSFHVDTVTKKRDIPMP